MCCSFVFAKFEHSLENNAASTTQSHTIPTYLALFIFGFLYQLGLAYDALRLKNTIQIIGICVSDLALLTYAAVQTDQIKDAVNVLASQKKIRDDFWDDVHPYLIAIPCIIALCFVLLSGVAWKLYDEFAWTIYKHISADLRMKRRYLIFQIYIALLKFDFFFFLGFTVQFLVVVKSPDAETWLTVAAIPITVGILIMAGYWTRHESRFGMLIIIVLYFAAMAYFLFKLVRMYDTSNDRWLDYLPARRSLTFFAIITVLLLVVTIINAIWCMINFGKGLKPIVQRRKVPAPEDKNYATEYSGAGTHPLGQVSSRMTID
ncbi:hypothetical protein H2203_004475 [Taxawa tesnikishii (nom. ined.)]|nr:hypothetical protein H2203_004475 [Dothideales sp. JES 119]